jgi:hypothetical protein
LKSSILNKIIKTVRFLKKLKELSISANRQSSLSLLPATSPLPPEVKSRADYGAPGCQRRPGNEIDDIVMPEVDRGKDEGSDDRAKEIEEQPGVTIG